MAWPSSDARATIILRMDLPQMVGRSDVIFMGKVVKTRSRWTADKRHIVTDTTFKVERGIKGIPGGNTGGTIVVRRLGGSVGGIGMRVSGMPVFSKDEQVLLFTERRRGHRYVVGMKQGVFKIQINDKGQRVVRANLSGLTLARRSPEGSLKMLERNKSSVKPRLLGDFIERIRETIALCTKESKRCRTAD